MSRRANDKVLFLRSEAMKKYLMFVVLLLGLSACGCAVLDSVVAWITPADGPPLPQRIADDVLVTLPEAAIAGLMFVSGISAAYLKWRKRLKAAEGNS